MYMWHYQVVKCDGYYAIVEYFPDVVKGKPGCTDPIIVGDDVDDLVGQLAMMLRDVSTFGVVDEPQSSL